MAFRSGAAPRRKGGKDVFEPLEVYPALVLNNHLGAINQIILHQNTLVTSSSDGKITIWDYDRKAVIHEFRGDSKRLFLRGSLLFCVAFGAFGNEPGEVNVYNFKKKQFVCSYRGHTLFITDCILFEDVIVTASADQTVRVWDAVVNFEDAPAKPEERASRRILQGHSGIVNCLLWSGGYVWSGSADQTVKAWNMQTANCAVTLTGHTGSVICLETSKDLIYSGGADSTIRTWDPRNGTCISTIKLKGSITQLIHHTDHLFCLTSTETAITQVHPRSGKVIKRLEGHTGKVLTMKATLHNLYTGSEDGFVRRWSIKNGTCWAVLRGHKDRIHSLLSANASSLLSGSADTNTVFWDILRHDDEVPADVDEEEKWFVKMKAQDLKEQELYANLIKQRLNAQKSPANILAPPPALVPPPTLVVPTAGAAPVSPPPAAAAAAAASPAAASPAPKRDEKVSALAFLSEPVTAAAKPAKDKERKNSAAATGSNRSSGASPMRDRAATGHTYASWAAVVEAASIDSSEVAQCAKLPLADAHKLTVDDYVHVGVKHPNAQRLVRLFAP